MAQGLAIPVVTGSGAQVLAALSTDFEAIVTEHSGTSFPGSTWSGMRVHRTDESRFYRRNDANDGWLIEFEYARTTDPVPATDDTTLGYYPGSRINNTTDGTAWYCLDATDGAAVWAPIARAATDNEIRTGTETAGRVLSPYQAKLSAQTFGGGGGGAGLSIAEEDPTGGHTLAGNTITHLITATTTETSTLPASGSSWQVEVFNCTALDQTISRAGSDVIRFRDNTVDITSLKLGPGERFRFSIHSGSTVWRASYIPAYQPITRGVVLHSAGYVIKSRGAQSSPYDMQSEDGAIQSLSFGGTASTLNFWSDADLDGDVRWPQVALVENTNGGVNTLSTNITNVDGYNPDRSLNASEIAEYAARVDNGTDWSLIGEPKRDILIISSASYALPKWNVLVRLDTGASGPVIPESTQDGQTITGYNNTAGDVTFVLSGSDTITGSLVVSTGASFVFRDFSADGTADWHRVA